jgi:hypothetical protein
MPRKRITVAELDRRRADQDPLAGENRRRDPSGDDVGHRVARNGGGVDRPVDLEQLARAARAFGHHAREGGTRNSADLDGERHGAKLAVGLRDDVRGGEEG